MSIEIINEAEIFIKAIFLGVFLCVIYDFFRIIRRIVKKGTIITGIEDILFFVFSALIIFSYLYKMNGGIIRIYIFVAILMGVFVYEEGIGKFVVKYISKILKKCIEVLKKCFKPIRIVFNRSKNKKRGALVAKERKEAGKERSE